MNTTYARNKKIEDTLNLQGINIKKVNSSIKDKSIVIRTWHSEIDIKKIENILPCKQIVVSAESYCEYDDYNETLMVIICREVDFDLI